MTKCRGCCDSVVPAVFSSGEGNAFGSILCDLGTTETDALNRLHSIKAQMDTSKKRLAELGPQLEKVSG
jgi:hypothetical protein